MNSTCPFCGAETRPGDNFCLSCGNRLLSATPSPQQQQAQPGMGEATIPSQDGWGQPQVQSPFQAPIAAPAVPAAQPSWLDPAMPTIAGSSADELPTTFGSSSVQTAPPAIEHAAKFILRADSGEVLQEYPLEKTEISIGRAPNSDILLSKDKLTSRRHATVRYSNSKYVLHDEHSANGTFVNGQQLDEASSHELRDGDHIGIGEHELIFRGSESTGASESMFADMPTVSVPYNPAMGQELTYRTRDDELATSLSNDDFSTRSMDENNGIPDNNGQSAPAPVAPPASAPVAPVEPLSVTAKPEELQYAAPVTMQNNSSSSAATPPTSSNAQPVSPTIAPVPPIAPVAKMSAPPQPMLQSATYTPPVQSDANVTFNRLTSIAQPSIPDISPLLAALSTLDGQVMTLQEQLNATQGAVKNHEAEVAQATSQLRAGVRRVSERMDDTIADVARNREALAWAELLQLMEDVMNNPRDVEYITKLARKARELNKVFQLHQSVLNTLAECNSLLRSLLGDDRQQ